MKQVEVYMVRNKPIHLAYSPEKKGKEKQPYQPHCGSEPEGVIETVPLQNLNLGCDICDHQVKLLKEAFGVTDGR